MPNEECVMPAEKLLMGLPFYGYSWTAVDNVNNGIFQVGRDVRGDQPYSYIRTLAAPFSAYRDERSQAPWLFDGQTFWTYEDPTSVRYKVSYALHQHVGGVMIWELSGDTRSVSEYSKSFRLDHNQLGSISCLTPTCAAQNEFSDTLLETLHCFIPRIARYSIL